ncbi:hypothetical protein ACIPV2_12530 [Microbacterium sp. NPDC089987]|uniref:hypothetical protein n=1 Tax=Microbacterium sp. NPDC089987 TaxID=3364202 RepID=UPI0037F1CADC
MITIWKRALATTAIALVAGVGLTACDSGADKASDSKGSQSQTESQKQAKPSATMTADDFAQRINDAQIEAGSTHFAQTMEVSGQKIESSGDMVVDADPRKTRMAMSMPGGMELRLVDGEMYLNMGELTGGKFYQPSSEAGNPITEQLNGSLDQANLGKQMSTFKTALKDFTAEEDAETIDGVKTTKYTLVLDSKKLFEAQELEIPAEAGIGDTIEYVIFAGDDDLPRRMVTDLAGSAITMDFSKWGEDVSIETPAPDEITDKAPGM